VVIRHVELDLNEWHVTAFEGRAVLPGSTALSATLYERGRTAHSMFGIPIQENSSDLVSRISLHSGRAELLRQAALILWEEFPMANEQG
jgi:PIF1-like helicase